MIVCVSCVLYAVLRIRYFFYFFISLGGAMHLVFGAWYVFSFISFHFISSLLFHSNWHCMPVCQCVCEYIYVYICKTKILANPKRFRLEFINSAFGMLHVVNRAKQRSAPVDCPCISVSSKSMSCDMIETNLSRQCSINDNYFYSFGYIFFSLHHKTKEKKSLAFFRCTALSLSLSFLLNFGPLINLCCCCCCFFLRYFRSSFDKAPLLK